MAIYNYITETGVIVPDAGEIQTGVETEYKNTFGQDLVVTANTPQGLLISSETSARIAVADNNASLANQINPNLAGGIFLDAILALTGSFRTPATHTTVLATIQGVEGTIIPQGSQASETGSGTSNIFETLTLVTIPAGGSIQVTFQSVETGSIPCPTGTLTVIISAILGWEQLTGSTAPTLGQATQSDSSARALRTQTLASQGVSLAQAITSALFNAGATSLVFLENTAATTQVISGVTMVSHSIYACVDGGTDLNIANALIATKSAGASYNNGPGIPISQTVVVPYSGQTMVILFDRPNLITIYIRVSVQIIIPVQNPITAVQQAILDYASGSINNVQGLGVGKDVSPFELAGAITIEYPGIYVQSLTISLSPSTGFDSVEIPIASYEKANILQSNIVVTVL